MSISRRLLLIVRKNASDIPVNFSMVIDIDIRCKTRSRSRRVAKEGEEQNAVFYAFFQASKERRPFMNR